MDRSERPKWKNRAIPRQTVSAQATAARWPGIAPRHDATLTITLNTPLPQHLPRSMSTKSKPQKPRPSVSAHYSGLVGGIGDLFESARRASARAVNAFMTATYWEVGRRIVEFEQGGAKRAEYGED
jgi:hypothetical protein